MLIEKVSTIATSTSYQEWEHAARYIFEFANGFKAFVARRPASHGFWDFATLNHNGRVCPTSVTDNACKLEHLSEEEAVQACLAVAAL